MTKKTSPKRSIHDVLDDAQRIRDARTQINKANEQTHFDLTGKAVAYGAAHTRRLLSLISDPDRNERLPLNLADALTADDLDALARTSGLLVSQSAILARDDQDMSEDVMTAATIVLSAFLHGSGMTIRRSEVKRTDGEDMDRILAMIADRPDLLSDKDILADFVMLMRDEGMSLTNAVEWLIGGRGNPSQADRYAGTKWQMFILRASDWNTLLPDLNGVIPSSVLASVSKTVKQCLIYERSRGVPTRGHGIALGVPANAVAGVKALLDQHMIADRENQPCLLITGNPNKAGDAVIEAAKAYAKRVGFLDESDDDDPVCDEIFFDA